MTQKQIAAKLKRIRKKIESSIKELRALQSECKHPNVNKKYGSNTGNYDPTADCYWIDFNCPDCEKTWWEDQ